MQNAEQNESALWGRVRHSRNIFKPIDIVYDEYQRNNFQDLHFSNQDLEDPDMQSIIKYIEGIKSKTMKFEDIPTEYRQKLADLITREQ